MHSYWLLAIVASTVSCVNNFPERDSCEDVTCSGHGECIDDGDATRCSCDPGFYADRLQCLPVGADGDGDGDGDGGFDRDADEDLAAIDADSEPASDSSLDVDVEPEDTRPPATGAEPTGATRSNSVEVVLTADEAGCTTHYTLDGSDPTTSETVMTYMAPIRIEESSILRFFSTDPAGNQETPKTEVYEIVEPGTVLRAYAIPGSEALYGVAFDGSSLWISDWNTKVVYEMDPETGIVLGSFAVDVSNNLSGLAWDGSSLWINTLGRTTHQYATDGTELGSCDTGVSGLMGATFVGDNLFFGSDSQQLANELDVSACEILGSFSTPWNDDGLTWDGEAFWSADWSSREIYRLSPIDYSIEYSIPAPGRNPAGLEWDGLYLWSCSWADQLIYQIVP